MSFPSLQAIFTLFLARRKSWSTCLPREARYPASRPRSYPSGWHSLGYFSRADPTAVVIREDPVNGVHIGNLIQKKVEGLKQMIALVRHGLSNQGRGHSIFTISLCRLKSPSVRATYTCPSYTMLSAPSCSIEGLRSRRPVRWSIWQGKRVLTT